MAFLPLRACNCAMLLSALPITNIQRLKSNATDLLTCWQSTKAWVRQGEFWGSSFLELLFDSLLHLLYRLLNPVLRQVLASRECWQPSKT